MSDLNQCYPSDRKAFKRFPASFATVRLHICPTVYAEMYLTVMQRMLLIAIRIHKDQRGTHNIRVPAFPATCYKPLLLLVHYLNSIFT